MGFTLGAQQRILSINNGFRELPFCYVLP